MAFDDDKLIAVNAPAVGSDQPLKQVEITGTELLAMKDKTDALAGFPAYLDFTTAGGQTYKAGRISFDPVAGSFLADTNEDGVRVNIGQELQIRVYNDTGVTLTNGTPISGAGVVINGFPSAIPTDVTNEFSTLIFLGVTTQDILDGESGLSTVFGAVRGIDTSLFTTGPIYIGAPGEFTKTLPVYPNLRLFVGGVVVSDAVNGEIFVNPVAIPRKTAGKSYGFTSNGVPAGTYWKGGFYDWSPTSASLTQASLTQTYGVAGRSKSAHASIVAGGAGIVDTGQVGLRVTGILDSETGVQLTGQTEIITDDITTLVVDNYYETSGKFSGEVTYELYIVSGSPTAYSLDMNYGFSKYEDFQNRDSTITEFEIVWLGGANDTSFDVALKHHKTTGWTYSAAGFEAGNGDICRRTIDQAEAGNVASGVDGSYKRTGLNVFVDGNASEGILIEIITGANGTVQTSDLHISGVSEELTF